MTYLIDANVFIQAKNLHYGLDFCPAFWDWLIRENAAGKVASIEKVRDEINGGEDDLSRWVQSLDGGFFLPVDGAVSSQFQVVSTWVSGQRYEPAAISLFLQVADFYLVAHAKAHGSTIVTHERHSDSIKKVKIPDVCIGLGISCITPYEMLRRERARFVLGSPVA